jgi:WD40 repeat protein
LSANQSGAALEYYKELWDEERFTSSNYQVVRHVSDAIRYYYAPWSEQRNKKRYRPPMQARAFFRNARSFASSTREPPLISLQAGGDVVALSVENIVALYDTSNRGEGKAFCDLRAHAAPIQAIAFSPRAPFLLATRDTSGTIQIWPPVLRNAVSASTTIVPIKTFACPLGYVKQWCV